MACSLWDDVYGHAQNGTLNKTNLSANARKLFRDLATVADGWQVDVRETDGFLPMTQWTGLLDELNP